MFQDKSSEKPTRREVLHRSGVAAAGVAVAASLGHTAHAADDQTIRLALIGCGGRGGGAVGNALGVSDCGPVKLHAMADIFGDRLNVSHKALSNRYGEKVDVPDDRKFVGFDAYKRAIDTLRPGDVAMLTAYAYCRPLHYEYAVSRGVNVFMEKSFAADPAGVKRMLAANETAKQKNLKIAAGLQCRHSVARQAFIEKVRAGELGDLMLVRAYRMHGSRPSHPFPGGQNELAWQMRNKWQFIWITAGTFSEWMIHQVDECCWLMDDWPTEAHALGGRVPWSTAAGQNLDTYAIEYRFPGGRTALVDTRFMNHTYMDFATYVNGTRRAGQFSGEGHRATVMTYKGRTFDRDQVDWTAPGEPCGPWDAEWRVMLAKIRSDAPHNETERACRTNIASIMGRAASHLNHVVTWEQVADSDFSYGDVDTLAENSEPLVKADTNGRYPAPIPGRWKEL